MKIVKLCCLPTFFIDVDFQLGTTKESFYAVIVICLVTFKIILRVCWKMRIDCQYIATPLSKNPIFGEKEVSWKPPEP